MNSPQPAPVAYPAPTTVPPRGASRTIARVAACGAAAAAVLTLGVGFTASAALVLAPGLLSRPNPPRRRVVVPVAKPASRRPHPVQAIRAWATDPASPLRSVATTAAVKTVTYEMGAVVTTFALSSVFVGNAMTAATLSAIWFVAAPILYFAHEVAWTRLATLPPRYSSSGRPMVAVRIPWGGTDIRVPVRRDIAKTLTWRCVAAATDFVVIYALVGSVIMAAELTAAGVVVGTCVYYVHEYAWDAYGQSRATAPAPVAGLLTTTVPGAILAAA